ncbi:nucleotidyltransferase family protein [uncultured Mucilaginibacter sp.]|uniref:nucleotidyltransferase family protein n=1 Tax=uncultured Mucilaginibacter sp. TaxID=797541 RepID=UPI0025CFD6E0|nr:nucleotidyltransferase family protein [uncultured Mucilaginibacter sp.]
MIAIDEIKKNHGTEMAAIILCCRFFFKTSTIDELKGFISDNDVDWYALVRLALKHRIRPTIYKILHLLNLPPDIKVLIYHQQTEITKLNWKQAIETERLILLLAQNGIEAVPYKGAAFSKQFFGDLISRESSDIDLVIKSQDLEKAIAIFKNDGYLPEIDHVYKYLGEAYCSYYKDYNLNKFKNGIREFHVELHWAIGENYLNINKNVNAFINRCNSQIALVKYPVKALSQPDHFSAILVHHGIKDTFRYLKNIVDLCQAIQQLDVQKAMTSVKSDFETIKLSKVLAVGNFLSIQLMGVAMYQPQSLLNNNNTTDTFFINQLCSGNVLGAEDTSNVFLWIKRRALLQDSSLQQFKFYWVSLKYRFIPGEADFDVIQLPRLVFFIYYFMKPFRSLIKPLDTVEKKQKLIPADQR